MKKVIIPLFLLFFIRVVNAQREIPYGFEYQSDFPYNNCIINDVAVLKNGNLAVCWDAWGRDDFDRDVFAQLMSPDLKTLGEKINVNIYLDDNQYSPKIAAIATGDFVVCWSSMKQDGSVSGVYAQRFSSSGERIGDEFRVNTYTKDAQFNQGIAPNLGGEFMICWQSWGQDESGDGIFGQIFTDTSEKLGNEFQINTRAEGSQINPAIAACSDTSYIVCWENLQPDGIHTTGISGQRFSSTQGKIGGEFHVDIHNNKEQALPVIVSHPNGNFLICWNDSDDSLDGSSKREVYGQFFSKDNRPMGESIRINSHLEGYQQDPFAMAIPELGFIDLWNSFGQDLSGSGIYGKLFSCQGDSIGYEFRVNSTTTDDQWNPKAVLLSSIDYLVMWHDGGMINPKIKVCGKCFASKPLVHSLRPFALRKPLNDVTLDITDVDLDWQQSSDQPVCYPWELHYCIYIDDNPDFTSPWVIEQDLDTTAIFRDLKPGTTYFSKVLAKNIAGDSLWSSNTNGFFMSQDATSGIEEEHVIRPREFTLHQNYPNPFNPETSIRFDLPQLGFVLISVIDVSGRLVRVLLSESRTAGSYSVKWDGRDSAGNAVPSGIYVCRMEVRSADGHRFNQSVKMGLVR